MISRSTPQVVIGRGYENLQRASILLNLYGRQAVQHKHNFLQSSRLSLHRTAWQPYRLSKRDALHINISYPRKDQFVKICQKLLSFWWRLKNSVFLIRPFWNCFSKKNFFLLHSNLNQSQMGATKPQNQTKSTKSLQVSSSSSLLLNIEFWFAVRSFSVKHKSQAWPPLENACPIALIALFQKHKYFYSMVSGSYNWGRSAQNN